MILIAIIAFGCGAACAILLMAIMSVASWRGEDEYDWCEACAEDGVPPDIHDAAVTVAGYFADRGQRDWVLHAVRSSHTPATIPYALDANAIPAEMHEAAQQLRNYFEVRGIPYWSLHGVRSDN
jgi:hypothetical protein